jgi:dipeptidyl aminopeptidase/acylaminoacyl peptidase
MVWLALLPLPVLAATLDPAPYLRKDPYESIKISPTGEYYAATVPLADRTILVIQRRSDHRVTAKVGGLAHSEVAAYRWVNNDRLVVGMAEKSGVLDSPQLTGDVYAINADGSSKKLLIGPERVSSDPDDDTAVFEEERGAYLDDSLLDDDGHVLVAVQPFDANPLTHVERVDVYSGAHTMVASAPVRNAKFTADASGVVRFAEGSGNDNSQKLYYRKRAEDPWRLMNDEAESGHREVPVGFSDDGQTAYLQTEHSQGPDSVEAMDTNSGQRHELLRDPVVNPFGIIYQGSRNTPVGAYFMSDRLHARFFDESSPSAKQYRRLEAAFPGEAVEITSCTADARLCLVHVFSDRNPGDFYLFDVATQHADLLLHQREWFDPESMAATRERTFPARDGLILHAYLTLPVTASDAPLPMVVLPHGGPIGPFDSWGFDAEVQMLAAAGYAVLQVNYRGSGNYGRAFLHAGERQWGGRMQDDLTDATRWAIAQKIADPERICLYGGSYGGYAALMGVAREPSMYRCAVGYAGVYDLAAMARDDARLARWARTWNSDWVGPPSTLAAISPVHMADRIKVPVLLVAGGRDDRAPIAHSKAMEKALRAAGASVETLYVDSEGHGFYTPEHQLQFYTRLLDFLERSLGRSASKRNAAATK